MPTTPSWRSSRRSADVRAARTTVRELQAMGWTVELRNSGHFRATHPNASGPLFLASSPSDQRGHANALSLARRLLRQGVSPSVPRT